jgi:hypothetical protein
MRRAVSADSRRYLMSVLNIWNPVRLEWPSGYEFF